MRQLAHNMFAQRADIEMCQDGIDFLHDLMAAGRRDRAGFQRVMKDKQNAPDQRNGKNDPERNQPRAGVFVGKGGFVHIFHMLPPLQQNTLGTTGLAGMIPTRLCV